MKGLQLYTLFHLNLAYSSIEEEERARVIEVCYWPLLKIARQYGIPIGIEASGYTLESIAQIDPAWVSELGQLVEEGLCEFIGSGYAQIIGPLVPAEVNAANLRIGHQVYQRVLGRCPSVALVNEQAYSAGMISHYRDAGYEALIMEWDNPARNHQEWNSEWRYFPQYACGQHGEEIPVIWNKSLAFQKFQRYAHGDLTLEEYLGYLASHIADTPRVFPLYGNDVEIFDFRPGRYETEGAIHEKGEWSRLELLFESLIQDGRFHFLTPCEVLHKLKEPDAGHRLHLESPGQPIPVKKQGKYNVIRWAVTGRDDAGVNATCWQCFDALKRKKNASEEDWKELCYLWSSDFRTHITEKRWRSYQDRLRNQLATLSIHTETPRVMEIGKVISWGSYRSNVQGCRVDRCGQYVDVETDSLHVRLNCRRGLAIDGVWFKHVSDQSLIGTLSHGYYDDISMGADFYSGHLIFEAPGRPKLTDLALVAPEIWELGFHEGVCVRGTIATSLGPIHKSILIRESGEIRIEYELHWPEKPPGALRLGHMTLNPEVFDPDTLYVKSHNGGYQPDVFPLAGQSIDHGRSVSFLVSATSGLAMTENVVAVGDSSQEMTIQSNHGQGYSVALLTSFPVGSTYFFRIGFSAGEFDDTTCGSVPHSLPLRFGFSLNAQRVETSSSLRNLDSFALSSP